MPAPMIQGTRSTVGGWTGTHALLGICLFNILYMFVPNLFPASPVFQAYFYYKHFFVPEGRDSGQLVYALILAC